MAYEWEPEGTATIKARMSGRDDWATVKGTTPNRQTVADSVTQINKIWGIVNRRIVPAGGMTRTISDVAFEN